MSMGVRIAVGVGILLLLSFFGAAFLLPSTWQVQQSIVIEAPTEAIYPWIADLSRWRQWSPWRNAADPTLKYIAGDKVSGQGATLSWRGAQSGSGRITLVRAEPEHGVWYEMSIEDGRFKPHGSITFEKAANGTRVVWNDAGTMGKDIAGRYFVPIIKRTMNHNYAVGLADLKRLVEKPSPP